MNTSENYIIQDANLSILLNTFKVVKSIDIRLLLDEDRITIKLYYKNDVASICIYTNGEINPNIVYLEWDEQSGYKTFIYSILPNFNTSLDLIGLLKGYKALCKHFNVTPKLSTNSRFIAKIEAYNDKPTKEKAIVKRGNYRMKPYHLSFENESFRNLKVKRKKSNCEFPYITKYCTESLYCDPFGNTTINYTCIINEKKKTYSLFYSTYNLIIIRMETLLIEREIAKLFNYNLDEKRKFRKLINLKTKTKFSSPRIKNKQNLRKHVEDFNNNKEFYQILKTL